MKFEIKETEDFKPFDLTITVENRDDLLNLYHRFNIGLNVLNGETIYRPNLKEKVDTTLDDNNEIWKALSDKLYKK